jgi:hypothetical protein
MRPLYKWTENYYLKINNILCITIKLSVNHFMYWTEVNSSTNSTVYSSIGYSWMFTENACVIVDIDVIFNCLVYCCSGSYLLVLFIIVQLSLLWEEEYKYHLLKASSTYLSFMHVEMPMQRFNLQNALPVWHVWHFLINIRCTLTRHILNPKRVCGLGSCIWAL